MVKSSIYQFESLLLRHIGASVDRLLRFFLSPDRFDIFQDIFPARCREKKTAPVGRLSCLFGFYRRVTTGITMGERLVVLKR